MGVVIKLEGIKIEKEKVKEILDWQTSFGVKNIQKFLKLANYYWQFIKDFVFIARPLHNLVKKRPEVELDREVEKDIEKVERKIYKRTSISSIRLEQKKMRMEVDTSDYTTKGILSIEYEDGK